MQDDIQKLNIKSPKHKVVEPKEYYLADMFKKITQDNIHPIWLDDDKVLGSEDW